MDKLAGIARRDGAIIDVMEVKAGLSIQAVFCPRAPPGEKAVAEADGSSKLRSFYGVGDCLRPAPL